MSKFNVGDKVRYIGKPDEVYGVPKYGDVGYVASTNSKRTYCQVIWKYGSFSYIRHCDKEEIEMVIDMTNEEIWEMLRSKMEKHNILAELGVLCQGEDKLDQLLNPNIIEGKYVTDVYNATVARYAIALAYKVGYLRAIKGRPFKIGERKKKGGHWEPVDPNNLPKEGTKVRYSRKNIDWANSTYVEIGDTGTVQFWEGYFGFNLDVSKGLDWICILTQADCLDMWVEDDE